MRPFRRTHWNKIAWEREFIINDEGPYGRKLKTDISLEEIQPENKPNARIKAVTVKILLTKEDWYQKTGHEIFKGTCDGVFESKEPIRFTTSTKHKNPEEEEEEDQVDVFNINIEPAEPKTEETEMPIEDSALNANMNGTTEGAHVSMIELEPILATAGSWQGVAAGAYEGGITGSLIGAQVEMYNLVTAGPVTGTIDNPTVVIPEITIKDPERKGKMKWKMIDRETKDTGMTGQNDIWVQWVEAKEPKEVGLGEEPLQYVPHMAGMIGTIYLIKCPIAVYHGLQIEEDGIGVEWGEDFETHQRRWSRWVLDAEPIELGKTIRLKGRQFGLRTNEILFTRMTMQSWGMTSLTGGVVNRKRIWFGQTRVEAYINWY
jgi:hypothetical protein